jgi:hypothetical protein
MLKITMTRRAESSLVQEAPLVAVHVGRLARPHADAQKTIDGVGLVPASGDFDGDGFSDVFLHGPGSTADVVWWGGSSRTSFGSDP